MKHIRPSSFALAASDVLVFAGVRYRPILLRADGLTVTRADQPATPISISLLDLSRHLEIGTLTIEHDNAPSEVVHG